MDYDVIIVGSGPSAIHAAIPLVESGARVGIIDPGTVDSSYRTQVPESDFEEIRRTDTKQHRYFLGDNFEGVPFGPVRVGAQLTPPRQHLIRDSDKFQPTKGKNFTPVRSLARGGLGAGWGASSMPFSEEEFKGWPVTKKEMQPYYEAVSKEIGISGSNEDDLVPYLGTVEHLQPPPKFDSNAESIYSRYKAKKRDFQEQGFSLGHPRLALLTKDLDDRKALQYTDMEFWADHQRAMYRPQFTLEKLRVRENVEVLSHQLLRTFDERKNKVVLTMQSIRSGQLSQIDCKRLVIAAGTMSTAQIVLESRNAYEKRLPFVSNPYTYFPGLNWRRLGQKTESRRHSMTQLTGIYDPDGTACHVVQPQIYSYRSLLLFKLIKESPFAAKESRALLRSVSNYFVITGVFHEDRPSQEKSISVVEDAGNTSKMDIRYQRSAEEDARQARYNRAVCRILRQLGVFPFTSVEPGQGSSIHYGGPLPMKADGDEWTCTPEGQLRGTKSVFLADGAMFPWLPAKGPTFTMMANARRVGEHVAQSLSRGGR